MTDRMEEARRSQLDSALLDANKRNGPKPSVLDALRRPRSSFPTQLDTMTERDIQRFTTLGAYLIANRQVVNNQDLPWQRFTGTVPEILLSLGRCAIYGVETRSDNHDTFEGFKTKLGRSPHPTEWQRMSLLVDMPHPAINHYERSTQNLLLTFKCSLIITGDK